MSLLVDELDFPARRARFCRVASEIAVNPHVQGLAGFGTLQEKRLHAVIKKYLCENTDYHEVGIRDTRFLADVRVGDEIYEVQTGGFAPLKPKLQYLLEHTSCTVTVGHPIVAARSLCWIDPRDGSVSPARRVGNIGRPVALLAELYPLLSLLPNERLRFRLLSLSVCDYRLRDPKRRVPRFERIPLDLLEDVTFASPADLRELLPADLPGEPFPVSTFAKCAHLHSRAAYSAAHPLESLGILRRTSSARPMTFEVV